MSRALSIWVGVLSLLLCPFGAVAAAEGLGVLLTNSDLHGQRGSMLMLEGTIYNQTEEILYINGLSSTLDEDYGVEAQYEYFQQVMPRTLFPGEVWEGPLLKITISPDAPIKPRSFALGLLGGAHGLAQDILEVAYFGIDDSTTFVAVPDIGAPGHAALRSSPNPFASRMELSITLPSRQNIDVSVYNVTGRLVRHLFAGSAAEGLRRYAWDGADDAGGKLGSGIYYVRVRSQDRVLKTKVVLCR
jgi:hypothetical protein